MQEGEVFLVKTKSGREFLAAWTLAPGIDYFWNPVDPDVRANYMTDPVVSWRKP